MRPLSQLKDKSCAANQLLREFKHFILGQTN